MVSASAVPLDVGGVKQQAAKQKGLGGLFLMALGGVVLIGLVAVVFGLVPSNKVTNSIRDAIPGLKADSSDGWRTVSASDGSFTAEMPGEPKTKSTPFNAAGATMSTSAVTLGSETELSVAHGEMTRVSEPLTPIALRELGTAWAQDSGFEIKVQTETSFTGYPALLVEQINGRHLGKSASRRSLLVVVNNQLYVIQSTSVYPDHPQFDRLVNSVVLSPSASPTPDTTATEGS